MRWGAFLCCLLSAAVAWAQDTTPTTAGGSDAKPADGASASASAEGSGAASATPGAPQGGAPQGTAPKRVSKSKIPAKPVDAAKEKEEKVKAAAAAADAIGPQLKGDVIVLKSGSKLEGVQVMRETPRAFVVQVEAGVPPLSIPRNQVKAVQYDDIEPGDGAAANGAPGENKKPVVLVGVADKVSEQLMEKLGTDVSTPALDPAIKDFAVILAELGKRAGVAVEVDKSLQSLPAALRSWYFALAPGTTFGAVLRDEFLTEFPDLAVVYRTDKISIMSESQAREIREPDVYAEGGGNAPAPPPAPAPPQQPEAPVGTPPAGTPPAGVPPAGMAPPLGAQPEGAPPAGAPPAGAQTEAPATWVTPLPPAPAGAPAAPAPPPAPPAAVPAQQ